ncbi:MAG: hypothetical protein WCJ45_06015 [bacterium]
MIQIYKERVEKLVMLFNEYDPAWIHRRTWIRPLLNFDLGTDFFIRFFIKPDDDLTSLQNAVITSWADAIVGNDPSRTQREILEITSDALSKTCLIGTEIDANYLHTPPEEILYQQKCLDYVWWTTIKNSIYADVSQLYKKKLDNKAAALLFDLQN